MAFEQNVYLPNGITRALKAGGGSGNIPKVISNMYFTLEDGNENCIERLYRIDEVIEFVKTHDSVKEIFLFCNDEVIASWLPENFNLPSIQNATYENDVQRVGTVSENSLIGGRVIGIEGICFTLMACTHGYGMGKHL